MNESIPALSGLDAQRGQQALSSLRTQAANRGRADPATDGSALEAARRFEALLVHNMLKAMRTTTLDNQSSNEKSLYFDMFDEQIARIVTEGGGLGFAEQIAGQIDTPATPMATAEPVIAADLQRLRALVNSSATAETTPLKATAPAVDSQSDTGWQWVSNLWTGGLTAPDGGKDLQSMKRSFIEQMRHFAQQSANRLGTSSLPVLAIAAHESGWGRQLAGGTANTSNNLFGIKATDAQGASVAQRTTEYVDGQRQTITARFRAYDGPAESMDDFATFLQTNPRYSRALASVDDPEQFVRELQAAGYATDPRYADKVINVMQQISSLMPDIDGAPAT